MPSPRASAMIGCSELRWPSGLINVPINEAKKIIRRARASFLRFDCAPPSPCRSEIRDGLLYALVHSQALQRWLGLALDHGSFQSRHRERVRREADRLVVLSFDRPL